MIPYILVLLGLLLIYIEFFLPGVIIGAIGACLVTAGIFTFAYLSSSALATLIFTLISLLLVALLIRVALWRIPRIKPEKSIYSNSAQEGYYASSFDKTAIGQRGKVVSDLKPGGQISVNGKVHPALSISGYLSKGDEVEVIRGEGESLVVKQIKKE